MSVLLYPFWDCIHLACPLACIVWVVRSLVNYFQFPMLLCSHTFYWVYKSLSTSLWHHLWYLVLQESLIICHMLFAFVQFTGSSFNMHWHSFVFSVLPGGHVLKRDSSLSHYSHWRHLLSTCHLSFSSCWWGLGWWGTSNVISVSCCPATPMYETFVGLYMWLCLHQQVALVRCRHRSTTNFCNWSLTWISGFSCENCSHDAAVILLTSLAPPLIVHLHIQIIHSPIRSLQGYA